MTSAKNISALVGALLAGFVVAPFASAQTSLTWNSTATTNPGDAWATSTNWNPTTGISSSTGTYNLTFNSASTAYTSDDNTAITGLAVNAIDFAGSNTGTMTIGTSGSGGTLNFVTSGSTAPTIIDTTAANVADSISYTTTNALTVSNTGGATLTLSGVLTNTSGITFNGTGANDLTDIVSLGGNDVTGSGAITLNGGVLLTGVNRQLSNNVSTAGSGGAVTLAGGELASTGAVGTSNFIIANAVTITGAVQFGDSNHASVAASDVTLDNGSSLAAGSATTTSGTYTLQTGTSGVTFSANSGVTLTNNALIAGSNSVIYGSGNILINGGSINTYTGTTTVDSGAALTLSNVNANHFGVSGSALIVDGGTVNQTTASQIVATSALTIEGGGTYSVSGLSANTTLNSIGSLTIGLSGSDPKNGLTFVLPATGGVTNAFIKDTGGLTVNTSSPIVITLSGATTNNTSYALLSVGSGTIPLSDFTLGAGDSNYTLSLNGSDNTLEATYTSTPVTTNAYFVGTTSDLNTSTNYATTAAGGTPFSGTVGSNTNVFITSNNTGGAFQLTPTLNTGNLSILSLTLTGSGTAAAGQALSLAGTNTLTTGTGGISVLAGAGADTISAPIGIGAAQTWANASSNLLTISGGVSGSGNLALQDNSTGGITLSTGSVNFTGSIVNTGTGTGATTISSVIGSNVTSVTENSSTSNLALSNGGNTYSGGTTVTAGTLLLSNSSGSATGSGALNVGAGAFLAGTGVSSGSSFNITGNSTKVATVLVGQTSASDINTTGVLKLTATGASSIGAANLVFNINSNVAGQGNELSVGSTAITFNTVGSLNTTLTLNVEGSGFIAANTAYVLVAGTGTTTMGGTSTPTLTSGQYAGLETFVNSKGQDQIVTGSATNLELAFSNSTQGGYYAPSYLYIVDNNGVDDIDVEVVPEPSTWAMMLGGCLSLFFLIRRKEKARATQS